MEETVGASRWIKPSFCWHLVLTCRNHETATSAKLDTLFPLLNSHQHIPDPAQRLLSTIGQQVLHWVFLFVSGHTGLARCEVFAQVRDAPDQRREQKRSSQQLAYPASSLTALAFTPAQQRGSIRVSGSSDSIQATLNCISLFSCDVYTFLNEQLRV